MKPIALKARIRGDLAGKKSANRLRREGEIPAVIYGHQKEAVSLAVPEHDFWTILHNATTEHLILDLDVEGMETSDHLTLVRDVQHHPVSGQVLHVDFQRISFDEKIRVGVPVVLKGVPVGVKEFGGILDHGLREVLIHSTPDRIPEALEVDVTSLAIGNAFHVSDLKESYPDIEFIDDESMTVAHVSPPKKLEVLLGEEAEEGEEAVEGEEGEVAGGEEAEGAGEEGEEEA